MSTEVCRLEFEYPIRSIIWSNTFKNERQKYLYASSINLHTNNAIHILKLDENTPSLKNEFTFLSKVPITRMKAVQFSTNTNKEYLVTSSMELNVIKCQPSNKDFSIVGVYSRYKDPSCKDKRHYPISSFAIASKEIPRIYAALFDSNIDIWDFNRGTLCQSMKTADRECYDIDICSSNENLFTTVGLAGSIFIHDVRSGPVKKAPSFQMKHQIPLVRASWSPSNANYIVTIPFEDNRVFVYDIRCTSKPCSWFSVHKDYVNDLYWDPSQADTVLSIDASGTCLKWSIHRNDPSDEMVINHQTIYSHNDLTQFRLSPFSFSHSIVGVGNSLSYISFMYDVCCILYLKEYP